MTDTFLEKIRKELHISNCGFNYRKPDKFMRSQVCYKCYSYIYLQSFCSSLFFVQWQLQQKNVFYLLWRLVLAAFFIAAVVTSMASVARDDFRYYFIYLTNWGIILCMITSVYGAILVTYWHFNSRYAGKITNHFCLIFSLQNLTPSIESRGV